MKNISFCFLIIFGANILVQAQSIQISGQSATASNAVDEFPIAGETITMNGNVPAFISSVISADVNEITGISVAASLSGFQIFGVSGIKLWENDHEISASDNSLEIYAAPGGGFVMRENIANFLFVDSFGAIKNSVSNSSQSTEGESVSEFAADPLHQTTVLYNPKILQDGAEGSRARVVQDNGTTTDIFHSSDRSIKQAKVSRNAQFVGIVTTASGTDDQIHIVDRFGNDINTFSFNQPIADFRLADDASVVTVRSNSRVAVYSVVDGQRLGSTSFRSQLQFAEYIPEDETIVALTGSQAGNRVSDVEVHAINITQRAIERQTYNATLGSSPSLPLHLERTGTYGYQLSGFNQTLNITVRF